MTDSMRWALVPVRPDDEMVDRGRTAITAREVSSSLWSVASHYRASGAPTDGIPKNLLIDDPGKMPKGYCAELVFATMLAASPGRALLAEILAARDATGFHPEQKLQLILSALNKLGPAPSEEEGIEPAQVPA